MRLPGLKIATLMASPAVGGKVAEVDQDAALKVPGVRQVVVLDDLVAVVGDHFWAARQGLVALDPRWHDGANGARDSRSDHGRTGHAARRHGVVAKTRRRCRQGTCRRTRGSMPSIKCRSWLMRRWSR